MTKRRRNRQPLKWSQVRLSILGLFWKARSSKSLAGSVGFSQLLTDIEGIPKFYYSGNEGDYNVLVLELLGPNLEDLLTYCNYQLSLKSVLMIADQLISRMEAMHNRGFIHRDIKSDNFLIGNGENMGRVYAIDFGLAKRYVHPHTGQHIAIKKHKGLIGTARFASINAHLGLEQSRRDDLQSIGYLLIYLAKGTLPWMKLKAKNKTTKYKKILDLKDQNSPEDLSKGLPSYLTYVKRLEFEEKPDYHLLRSLFLSLLLRLGFKRDFIFDWMITEKKRKAVKRKIKNKIEQEKQEEEKAIQEAADSQSKQLFVEDLDQHMPKELMNPHKQGEQMKVHQILDNNSYITGLMGISNDLHLRGVKNLHAKGLSSDLLFMQNSKSRSAQQAMVQRILDKDYMQTNQNKQMLLPISEKNEEYNSKLLSDFSQLQLSIKIKSEISAIKANKKRSGLSPAKSQIRKSPKRKYKSGILIKKGILHLKELPPSDVKLSELVEEFEDDEDNVKKIYEFNIHGSKLDKETGTPKPVKRSFDLVLDKGKQLGNPMTMSRAMHLRDSRQPKAKLNRVSSLPKYIPTGKGILGSSGERRRSGDKSGKDSSMGTEYENSSYYHDQIHQLKLKL